MPTYDYICKDCGHQWELFQKMSDNPRRKCPSCGKLKAKRLIGAGAGLIFKGSGFYVTDYKKNRGGTDSAGSTEAPPACDSCPAKTGESAPCSAAASSDTKSD